MKVKFFNIEWDLDDLNTLDKADVLMSLPEEPVINVDDDTDIDAEGADILSDNYGWCVYGFDYEVLEEEKEITITIRAKEGWVVDGLRQLANAIENADEDITDFESDYFDASIKEV